MRKDSSNHPQQSPRPFRRQQKTGVGIIRELNRQIDRLDTELETRFEQHPDTDIIRSLPGPGVILGAQILGEFGDEPNRYAHAKSRRNYAGTSPITRASGLKRVVSARYVRNRRLYDPIDQWAFCAINQSKRCRAFHEERRTKGDLHHQALRVLGNRLVRILHGCLQHHAIYNEDNAWAHRQTTPDTKAA